MAYIYNPLIPDNLQKKQDLSILVEDESGELVDIAELVEKLQAKINSKLTIDFGPDGKNKVLITDADGKVTIIDGVVMTMQEREKLASLTSPMILKGIKNTRAEIEAVPNPEPGWVYFLPEGDMFLEYCYVGGAWEMIGTTGMQGKYMDREGGVTKTVGGLNAGTSIYGKTYDQIFTEIFFPYIIADGFKITPTGTPSNLTSVLERGTTVVLSGVKYSINKNSDSPKNFKVFKDSNYSNPVSNLVINGTSATFDAIAQSKLYATIERTDTVVMKASWAAKFVDATFYGVLNSAAQPTAETILKFKPNILEGGNSFSATYSADSQYPFIAVPAQDFGALSKVMDETSYPHQHEFAKYSLKLTRGSRLVDYAVYVKQQVVINPNFTYTYSF